MPEFNYGSAYEQLVQHALDNPMPDDLHKHLGDLLEAVTMNRGLDHGEAMSVIEIAYPLIRDYLASVADEGR
jgi:hypothetical protein